MLLESPATMARLHLAAWLHWRSDHRLAWETDEPLPPLPRQSDRPEPEARVGRCLIDAPVSHNWPGWDQSLSRSRTSK